MAEYLDVTNIRLGSRYQSKLAMLTSLARRLSPEEIAGRIPEGLGLIQKLGDLDSRVKEGKNLGFEEAYGGMLHVVCATNNLIRGVVAPEMDYDEAVAKGAYFLTMMAFKEAVFGLSSPEIAGMVAAGMLDVVYFPEVSYAFETSGMGADRGWDAHKRLKTINASTLTAFTLASLGYTTMKHGSYGNTTRVGSTDVPEQFGANICQHSREEIDNLLRRNRFWFSDAHSVKTLHYLSHLLMVETVNHVVGPMTPPVGPNTKLYKIMGVNHNVHPKLIAQAYTLLHRMGFVNLGGVIVLGGVDKVPHNEPFDSPEWFKEHSYLDELSPTATVVSGATGENYLGTWFIQNGDPFGVKLVADVLKIPNDVDHLMRANEVALGSGPLAEYLACNVALALLAKDLETGEYDPLDLKDNFHDAYSKLWSGQTRIMLSRYVKATGGVRRHWM